MSYRVNKSEIKPLLVNSDEEMSSDDENETESGEESHDDLKQNYINKSNETLYSINIYITDARIQTEIKNILQYYKIISQDYEINDKPHVNLIEFKTNTNRKSDLFKAIKDGVEEIV